MTKRWQEVAIATGLADTDGTARPTIFEEMSVLAVATGSANLGQGFPDEDGPEWVREIAVEAIRNGGNQYAPGRGTPDLRRAVATHQERHYGLTFDPDSEVFAAAGATEAITTIMLALAQPGDEVLTLEPFYDSHAAAIAMAGATHTTAPLVPHEDGFRLDIEAMRKTVTPRTRIILVNTPHNPTGTVLSRDELAAIAEEAQRVDAIVVSDEVYEHLTFDGAKHIPIASLPGMRDRTLTVSSAGKTFSLTGWKIGWVTGPAHLVDAALAIKQFLTYTNGAPFQPAIAAALESGDGDVAELRDKLAGRKERLITGLQDAGFTTASPAGTYFVCADASAFLTDEVPDGAAFARWLPENIGVACIPVPAFCREGSPTAKFLKNWVRFTFVKDDATLDLALERLTKLTKPAA